MLKQWGNGALGAMAETPPPADMSFLPLASGWKMLIALFALYFFTALLRKIIRYYRNAYRRDTMSWLENLPRLTGDSITQPSVLAQYQQVPQVLRSTALHVSKRTDISRLHNSDWENWLDQHCKDAQFSSTFQGNLHWLGYQPIAHSAADKEQAKQVIRQINSLIVHIRFWVENHRGRYD